MLGKKSYKTAWYLCHRIRAAMKEVNPEPLGGIVEMDETYVGGKLRGNDAARRRLTNKETVIGIKQRGGDLRFFHAADAEVWDAGEVHQREHLRRGRGHYDR